MFSRLMFFVRSTHLLIPYMYAIESKNHGNIIKYAKGILRKYPNHPVVLRDMADAYYKKNDIDKATYHAERSFRSDPNDLETMRLLTSIYYGQKDYAATYKYVTKALDCSRNAFPLMVRDNTYIRLLSRVCGLFALKRTRTNGVDEFLRSEELYSGEWMRWARGFALRYREEEEREQ